MLVNSFRYIAAYKKKLFYGGGGKQQKGNQGVEW